MKYLLDTVVLVRHLGDFGNIPQEISSILDNAKEENRFYISTISLMEILYLTEKHRIKISLEKIINEIEESIYYSFVDLSPDIVQMAKKVKFYELHDRMILATAKYLDIPVISPDKKFIGLEGIEIVW